MTIDLGTDLRVMLGPPGMAAHDASPLDLRAYPPTSTLETIDGRTNLGQALMLRLLTPRGALSALGHAAYGSRLSELIGRNKTDGTRALCKAFVLEAIAAEPRVDQTAIDFAFDIKSEGPSDVRFRVAVRPIDGDSAVELDLGLGL